MIKIMLDPGHYGSFYNASPCVDGYYESNMTWTLAGNLKAELEKKGFYVALTRENKDEDVELVTRGMMSRGYDLFLSLHSNASANTSADAPWSICFADDDSSALDEKSREVASRLGAIVSRIMGVSLPYIYTKKADYDRDGNDKLDDEWYGVLFGAKSVGTVGVILEHSFHTNERAARWLMNDDNLQKLAEAEAEEIATYFGVNKSAETKCDEKSEVEAISERLAVLEREFTRFDSVEDIPTWAKASVEKLISRGILKGDRFGSLMLSMDMLRLFVIIDRAGLM